MEDPQQLSVESVPYAWLANRNPSLDRPNHSFRLSFDATDRSSFIEMDPNLTPSKRFIGHQDLDFNVPKPEPDKTFVLTKKLASNRILVPSKSYSGFNIRVSPLGSTPGEEGRFRKSRSMSLRKCNRLPKTIVQKYMELFRPIWCSMRWGRPGIGQVQGVENCGPGPGFKTSGVCWARRCCDSESSIHEAVVHCKKTIGMD
ncbi:hypothetical protein E3N88_12689 [Mikania micrantha]|uniref:Uncharacterized protein n=1 Tax=Mikania micrantha TaxID=192012 RepID=A0A5N6P6E7_9ASTR|nr:hypothetical protein E3N88_12689 [Mikania micrantha]